MSSLFALILFVKAAGVDDGQSGSTAHRSPTLPGNQTNEMMIVVETRDVANQNSPKKCKNSSFG